MLVTIIFSFSTLSKTNFMFSVFFCHLQMFLLWTSLNSLPNNRIVDLSKFKAFADDNTILTQKLKFLLIRVENIVGNGENAGYHHFLLFPQCFQKVSFPKVLKVGILGLWYKVKPDLVCG